MPNIPTAVAPSVQSWLGVGRELTTGTPVAPAYLIPQDVKSYKPEDTPKFLPDDALRGVMGMMFGQVLGPEDASLSFGGPAFLDTYGFMLDNIFGDLSTTGTTPANSTTLSGSTAVGATSCTVGSATGYTNGAFVQIDTGALAETVKLSSAPSGSTLTFTGYPLRFAHASSVAVATVSAPFTSTFADLNQQLGYGGIAGSQPPTHTLTDHTGLNFTGSPDTNTTFARSYPSVCLSKIDLTGNAEQLLNIKFSGNSWLSAPPASAPVKTVTSASPVAAWRSTVQIGGASVYNVGDWGISITRKLQVYWTAQNAQTPFIIGRGELDVSGTMNFSVAQDEGPLNYMLNNTQPSVQLQISNGQSGANQLQLTFSANQAAFTKSAPDRGGVLIGFGNSFSCVFNSTNVGGSSGLGPATIALISGLIF